MLGRADPPHPIPSHPAGLCPGHRTLPGLPLPAVQLRACRRADGPWAPLEQHLPGGRRGRGRAPPARGRVPPGLWRGLSPSCAPPPQEYLAVTSVELIVRASVSVTSSIKNLVLKDASTQVWPPQHPSLPQPTALLPPDRPPLLRFPSPSTWTLGRRWPAVCRGGSSCWPCWPASLSWPCSSSSSGR